MGGGDTVVRSQRRRRWGIVLAAAAILGALPAAVAALPVGTPKVDTAELRQRMIASATQPYRGYALSVGALGLPSLPNLGQVTALVSGTTELRAWYAGRDRWRVDAIGPGTELDVYQTPDAQWLWDYGDNRLTRVVGRPPARLPRAADLTPPDLARRLLAIAGQDAVTPLAGRRVAGRTAAGLRVTPADPATTVAHIDIWADPGTGLPLQTELTAKGASRPVFVTRFLEVSMGVPDDDTVTPPAVRPQLGFSVTNAPDLLSAIGGRRRGPLPDSVAGRARRDAIAGNGAALVGFYGTGLAQFATLALPGRLGRDAYTNAARVGTAVTVADGAATVIAAGLLSVLVVRSERGTYLVAGMVDAAVLSAAAADLSGAAT